MADYEHNGKQLENTRIELFVALKYLLDNCFDEKHVSKTIDLEDYADKTYGLFLDRRRANDIFDSLVKLTNEYPNIIPYKVVQVGDKPRYYVERAIFSSDDISKIYNSIVNNPSLSGTTSTALANRFLDKVCNTDDKKKLVAKRQRKIARHRSSTKENRINFYKGLRDRQARFYFRIEKPVAVNACSSPDVANKLRALRRKQQLDQFIAGVVYDVVEMEKETDIWIYLPDFHGAVVLNMEHIIFDTNRTPSDPWNEYDFVFINQKFNDFDSMISSYYKGETGLLYNIKFKFYVGPHNEHLERVKDSYERFFEKEFVYTLGSRKVTLQDENGNPYDKVYEDIDAYSSIECNLRAFRKWYWEDKNFEYIVILDPSDLNNRLLTAITNRFIRRLQNYGYKPPKNPDALEHDYKSDSDKDSDNK